MKWCRENYHHDIGCPYSLRLASADAAGRIIIWDVSQGISLSEFSDGSKPVLDLHWLWTQDASHDLLAALHSPSSLVLWNADTGIKLWKKTFQESLICFAFDPFSPAKVTRKFCNFIAKNHVKIGLCAFECKTYAKTVAKQTRQFSHAMQIKNHFNLFFISLEIKFLHGL